METEYAVNRKWSDKFIPEICRICGMYVLSPADLRRDTTEATDLVLVAPPDLAIACRVRRSQYKNIYLDEFTVRTRTQHSTNSEFNKIMSGFATWMFYGKTDENEKIFSWLLIDLNAFRYHVKANPNLGVQKFNRDGSQFRAYNVNHFPSEPKILIARS